jgi:hypothetical protein
MERERPGHRSGKWGRGVLAHPPVDPLSRPPQGRFNRNKTGAQIRPAEFHHQPVANLAATPVKKEMALANDADA